MKGQTYVILGIIVVIIVAIFAVTNVGVVDVNYLFWNSESPLILVILFSVLMGVIISAAVGSYRIIHLQRELKKTKTEKNKMESLLVEHNLLDELDENMQTSSEIETLDK